MNRSEEDLARLSEWRRSRHLSFDRGSQVKRFTVETPPIPQFHFFNYDPDVGVADLSSISLQRDEDADRAIFSIPVSFSKQHRTKYKQHEESEFGFDLRLYMTRNNGPIFPLRK
jgi:hypothetical protein